MKLVTLGIAAALFPSTLALAVPSSPPGAAPFMVRDLASSRYLHAESVPRAFVPLGDHVLFLARIGDQESVLHSMSFPDLEIERLSAENSGYTWYEELPAIDGRTAYWYENDWDRLAFYSTDGTAAGTRILQRFPEPFSFQGRRRSVGALDGLALFAGYGESSGVELWRSDGGEAGTRLVVDLASGNQSSSPRAFVRRGNELCFFAHGTSDLGLYCSDGTSAGTRLVQRFESVNEGEDSDDPLLELSGRLVLVAFQDGRAQVVGSDGTPGGTVYLTNFPPAGSILIPPFRSGNRIYFVADDVVHGQELWQTDGTIAGTRRISEFGYADAFQYLGTRDVATDAGSWTYFVASDGLSATRIWRTNGDPASTQPIGGTDLQFDSFGAPPLTRVGSRVLFSSIGPNGRELYSIVSSSGAIELLADPCPGLCSSDPTSPAASGGAWFFEASDGDDREVWVTDGTPAGTRQVTLTENGLSRLQSSFRAFVYRDGRLVYSASDSVHGTEPFVSDLSGTVSSLVANLARGADSSFAAEFTYLGGSTSVFVFCSGETSRLTLGATTGGPGEVEILADLRSPCPSGQGPTTVTRVGNSAFVLDRSNYVGRLWRSDGTAAGTTLLVPEDYDRLLVAGTPGDGNYWFVRWNSDSVELWKAPEGAGAPALHATLPSNLDGAWEISFAGGYLYFVSTDLESGESRVVRAGTSSPSFDVLPPSLGYQYSSESTDPLFVWDGNYLYFHTGVYGSKLWRDDPASGSTLLLTPDPAVYGVRNLTAGDGFVYFVALNDHVTLWRSDGSVAGTSAVADLGPAPYDEEYMVRSTAVVGQWLAFSLWDESTGRELWVSDGTAGGTFSVPELAPGLDSSNPASFVTNDQALYFTATDPVHGREIWRVDFSAARVERLSDIGPGSTPGHPAELALAGDTLLFRADDGIHGAEVWALPLATGTCTPSPRTLCLDGGRFQLEASWADFSGGSGDGTAVPLTADTGYFWFFDPANVETVTKVLDGLGVNDRYWLFYGALSNVEYALDVTDTATRVKKRYLNPPGRYASIGDTDAFSPEGVLTAGPTNTVAVSGTDGSPTILVDRIEELAASGTCTPSETRLCLQQGRFAVEATWRDFQGNTGIGTAVPLSADTGYFWFFWDANVEVILKVLDGRPVNDRFWVYYGALSNVEYTLTVTDTATGAVKTYFNPSGRFASVGDNFAF